MWSFMRFMMTAIGLVLILIGVIMVVGISQSERMLTRSMSRLLGDAFGTNIHADRIRFEPSTATILLHGVSLHNPEGFIAAPAVTAEQVRIAVNPITMLVGTPIVSRMEISGAEIHYRVSSGGGSNLGVLRSRLLAGIRREAETGTRKVVVNRLESADAYVYFVTPEARGKSDGFRTITVSVERVADRKALTPGELTAEILTAMMRETLFLRGVPNPLQDALYRELGSDTQDSSIRELEPVEATV